MNVWAVSTVTLPALPIRTAALVDPDSTYIAGLISAGYLRVCDLDEAAELDIRAGRNEGGE